MERDCFPWGHVEEGESFVGSVIREMKEETGLDIYNPKLCGVKQFTTPENGRYVVILFQTEECSGELESSSEGEDFWIKKDKISTYNLAEKFMEVYTVFASDKSELYFYETQEGWRHVIQ